MRVPDHAAVTSTVELVRNRVGHKPAGFTNALMRRISERDLRTWMDELKASTAVRSSHPQWIVDELARAAWTDPRSSRRCSPLTTSGHG